MKRTWLAVVVMALTAQMLPAASDYLLELDGIKGESSDSSKPDAIEVSSFSWGVTNSSTTTGGAGGGGSVGKASFSDLSVMISLDKASPELFIHCATGRRLPKAILTCRKTGADGKPAEFLQITLTDVLISSFQASGAPPPAGTAVPSPPMQSISINFTKIEYKYTPANGTPVSSGYDLALGKKV